MTQQQLPMLTSKLPIGYTPAHNGLFYKSAEFGNKVEVIWRDASGCIKMVEHLTPEMFKEREKSNGSIKL